MFLRILAHSLATLAPSLTRLDASKVRYRSFPVLRLCLLCSVCVLEIRKWVVGLIEYLLMKKDLLKYLMPSTLSMCYSCVERWWIIFQQSVQERDYSTRHSSNVIQTGVKQSYGPLPRYDIAER